MGMLSRMTMIVKSKVSTVLDKAEDPRETLDYSYEKQMESLRKVKRSVLEMVTNKRRLELQAGKVQAKLEKLTSQAKEALNAGREDLARIALERKQSAVSELQALEEQLAGLEIEQEKLTHAEQRLQSKVEAFRTKKEIIKAQYNAAQAQVRIGSALAGVSEEMGDVSIAIERAQSKTESLQAKAGAIDELIVSGVLDDPLNMGKDEIEIELEKLSSSASVEDEIKALRDEIADGSTKQLEEGK